MSTRQVHLQTTPDAELEGEERFTLSLVAADNNADISPTHGDVTVVVLPDDGAAGVISIATNSTFLVMSEPTAKYSGEGQVREPCVQLSKVAVAVNLTSIVRMRCIPRTVRFETL